MASDQTSQISGQISGQLSSQLSGQLSGQLSAKISQLADICLLMLDELSVQYIGAMTPCTLSRLVYLADLPLKGFAQHDLTPDPEGPFGETTRSWACDQAIASLLSRGLATRGEHTDLEITAAGREYLETLSGSVLTGKPVTDAIRALGAMTAGFEDPYGSTVLSLTRMFASSMKDGAEAFLTKRYPGTDARVWQNAVAAIGG